MHLIARARSNVQWLTERVAETRWPQRLERVPTLERAALTGVLGGIALMGFGTAWDIHWHATVGRDSPWIPPHLAVYIGTVLAAAVGSAMLIGTRSSTRGFWDDSYAVVWTGGWLLLVAAVVDAIWHQLVGDSALWSPPHALGVSAAVIVSFGNVIGWRQARLREVCSPNVCRSVEILLLSAYMAAAYYALRAPVILAFGPDVHTPSFIVTTSPYIAAGLASVILPAIALWGREMLGRWSVDLAAVLTVIVWMAQELVHPVLTSWAAAQHSPAIELSLFPDARFGLLTLTFMLAPALIVNHTTLYHPVTFGVAMAGLYTGAVAMWLAIVGLPASVSPAGVTVIVVLGGLSGLAGAACARWINHVSTGK